MIWLTVAAALGGATPPLAEPLAPLQFLAGRCWAAPVGDGKQIDKHCFEPMYSGHHLRDRHVVTDSAGEVVYEGETIYAWNGSTKRIEFAYFSSDGGVSYGSVASKNSGNILDFGDETFNGPDGKELRISTEWQRRGDDAYAAISRSGFMPTGRRETLYRLVP